MDKLVADQPPLLEYGAVQAMFVCCLLFQSIYVAHIRVRVSSWGGASVCVRAGGEKKQQNMQSLNRGKKGIFSRREQMFSAETHVCPL